MEAIAEIMARMMDLTSDNASNLTDEQRLGFSRTACQRRCDRENARSGTLADFDRVNCDKCNNKGYYVEPENCGTYYTEKQVTCGCRKQRKPIRAMLRSGLQNVINDCTFEKFKVTEDWQKSVLDMAKRFIENGGENWFYFGGATGSGKTHLCSAISIELLRKGKDLKYMLWQDEAKKLKAHINENDYADLIEPYKNVEVLYIDDFFKVARSEFSASRPSQGDVNLAFEIINSRYAQKKITIISSECTLADLLDIDEATAGRIKQKCGEYCLSIAPDRNKNYRLKGV